MKVIHIESGLGNQMLSYCEYLAIKKTNPEADICIETLTYDIPECNEIICQWNGYELERIFGLRTPNLRDTFSSEEWKEILTDVKNSRFWLRNWNWPVCFQEILESHGLELKNIRGDFESKGHSIVAINPEAKRTLTDILRENDWYKFLKLKKDQFLNKRRSTTFSNEAIHFMQTSDNVLTGQRLTFKYIGSGIERIADDIQRAFKFPPHVDIRNKEYDQIILSTNSVAIHARRGDMLGYNYDCYRFGYFKRCVRFIRKRIKNPVFFIFCDPESITWAKENAKVFDLDFQRDRIYFIDWNKEKESFRDMQLMAHCKHQIITRSSFGWWGAWLNANPDKITCSPDVLINTTHHF